MFHSNKEKEYVTPRTRHPETLVTAAERLKAKAKNDEHVLKMMFGVPKIWKTV